ncbi:MAG: hypothetical protein HY081_05785 [Gammaproteobacteria bacterium]|nr:hypothetical protein [Gammaproteobacteria bacterium]
MWGVIIAVIVFFGLIIADFVISAYRDSFGPAAQIDAIAVGGGYSISLDATPAHPFLAEYKQSISVYGSEPRDGALLGRVEIPMNTGGRVRIGVLVSTEPNKAEVVLADRYATTRIELSTQKVADMDSWRQPTLRPIGIISGESYPIKFIPCAVWSLLSSREQQTIMGSRDELQGFCEAAQRGASRDAPKAVRP